MSLTVGLVSDLHLEFHRDGGGSLAADLRALSELCDVLIAAGDIAVGDGIPGALKLLCSAFKQVVYLTGNHEYYGTTRRHVHDIVEQACKMNENLHWLRTGVPATIDGQRFIGDTMWFTRHPTAPKHALNDFRLIRNFESWVYDDNQATVEFLRREVVADDIVVTHHLPSYRCVSPQYARSPLNPFFVCDVEDVITSKRPKLWVHGHTHDSVDLTLGDTRILANPFGYPHEKNCHFDYEKVVLS